MILNGFLNDMKITDSSAQLKDTKEIDLLFMRHDRNANTW